MAVCVFRHRSDVRISDMYLNLNTWEWLRIVSLCFHVCRNIQTVSEVSLCQCKHSLYLMRCLLLKWLKLYTDSSGCWTASFVWLMLVLIVARDSGALYRSSLRAPVTLCPASLTTSVMVSSWLYFLSKGPFTQNRSLCLKTADAALKNGFKKAQCRKRGSREVLLRCDALMEITENSQTAE